MHKQARIFFLLHFAVKERLSFHLRKENPGSKKDGQVLEGDVLPDERFLHRFIAHIHGYPQLYHERCIYSNRGKEES